MSKIYDDHSLSLLLHVHEVTLRRWRCANLIPYTVIGHHTIRYTQSQVDEILNNPVAAISEVSV